MTLIVVLGLITVLVDIQSNGRLFGRFVSIANEAKTFIAYLAFIGLCLLKAIKHVKLNLEYMPYLAAVTAYLAQAFFNISVVSVAYIFWIFLGVITNEHIFKISSSNSIKT